MLTGHIKSRQAVRRDDGGENGSPPAGAAAHPPRPIVCRPGPPAAPGWEESRSCQAHRLRGRDRNPGPPASGADPPRLRGCCAPSLSSAPGPARQAALPSLPSGHPARGPQGPWRPRPREDGSRCVRRARKEGLPWLRWVRKEDCLLPVLGEKRGGRLRAPTAEPRPGHPVAARGDPLLPPAGGRSEVRRFGTAAEKGRSPPSAALTPPPRRPLPSGMLEVARRAGRTPCLPAGCKVHAGHLSERLREERGPYRSSGYLKLMQSCYFERALRPPSCPLGSLCPGTHCSRIPDLRA